MDVEARRFWAAGLERKRSQARVKRPPILADPLNSTVKGSLLGHGPRCHMPALESMCLKIKIPTEGADNCGYRGSAINEIAQWLVSRGLLLGVIVLRDNLK
ncbi:unnamed protein product [Pleuronectes platessa]|uniref:Uncharacterized protein n=1 Tax=Pleuronectes platessa TaxID=8262 RepID=A0A9N7UGG7_PLEPL|nr:unnamed protein product [Pleuronectes platessa]